MLRPRQEGHSDGDGSPVVSVIIPAYNAEDSIGDCLRALFAQRESPPPYEVIVVDDGSTDATAAVARSWPVYVHTVPHGGAAQARNHGIAHSHGEILLFTDADCEPSPDWMQAMLRPFSDPQVVGVRGVYRTRQPGPVARFVQCEYDDKYRRLAPFQSIDFVDTYSAAYRRSAIEAAGGFDERIAFTEDQELSFRIAHGGGRLVFAPDALVFHRHADKIWTYARKKFCIGFWKVAVLLRHPDKIARDSHTPLTQRAQHVLFCLALISGLLAPFAPGLGYIAAGLLAALLLSTIPFAAWAWRRDRAVALIAPLMILLRTASLALGWLAGIAYFTFRRRRLAPAR